MTDLLDEIKNLQKEVPMNKNDIEQLKMWI